MGIMITYHGYNNPLYNMHRKVGVHYTQQNTAFEGKNCFVS